MSDHLYLPTQITSDEAAFGFMLVDDGTLVAAELRRGLYAVKVRCDDGGVGYCVCDTSLSPIHPMSRSLTALDERYRARAPAEMLAAATP